MNQAEVMHMIDDRRTRLPVDNIAPRHIDLHADLEGWGRWSRERRKRHECASLERAYRAPNGNIDMGWEHNAPQNKPVQIPNERVRALDRAILALPQLHLAGMRLHYWHMRSPAHTCRSLALHFSMFGGFMTTGRDMVINILRRQAQTA
jgi:hypothetical protein